jgi:hypothetical protein
MDDSTKTRVERTSSNNPSPKSRLFNLCNVGWILLFGTERPEHDDGKRGQLTGPWGGIEVNNDHNESRKRGEGKGGRRQNVMS